MLKHDEPISLFGYKTFRLDHPPSGTKGVGGLITFVRSDIGARQVPHLPFCRDCLCVELSINNGLITLISTYDSSGKADSKQLRSLIEGFHGSLFFAADMNLPNILWGSAYTSGRGASLHNDLEDVGLMLLNSGEPTHFSPAALTYSALDLTYCSTSLYATTSWRPLRYGSSDHFPLLVMNSTPIDVWQWKNTFWKLQDDKWPEFTAHLPSPSPPLT